MVNGNIKKFFDFLLTLKKLFSNLSSRSRKTDTKMTNEKAIEKIKARISELETEIRNRTDNSTRGGRDPIARADRAAWNAEARGLRYALAILEGKEPEAN